MDHTLIKPKNKGKFPKNADDWEWQYKEVPVKLKSLHEDGYRIVIFSNQGGVAAGKTKIDDIKRKI